QALAAERACLPPVGSLARTSAGAADAVCVRAVAVAVLVRVAARVVEAVTVVGVPARGRGGGLRPAVHGRGVVVTGGVIVARGVAAAGVKPVAPARCLEA